MCIQFFITIPKYEIFLHFNIGKKRSFYQPLQNALKFCTPTYHDRMSYSELHLINKRSTLEQMCTYKHALLLFKQMNHKIPLVDWIDSNFHQTLNTRSESYHFIRTNTYKIGCNNICNRLSIINNKINYNWIHESFDSYKLRCKGIFF